jgi:PAS domain S-box-containing protein
MNRDVSSLNESLLDDLVSNGQLPPPSRSDSVCSTCNWRWTLAEDFIETIPTSPGHAGASQRWPLADWMLQINEEDRAAYDAQLSAAILFGFDQITLFARWSTADGDLQTIRDDIHLVRDSTQRLWQIRGNRSTTAPMSRLLQFQSHYLQVWRRIATGASLEDVLTAVVRLIEREYPSIIASIMVLDEQRQRIETGVAPRLPAGYVDDVCGLKVGPEVGSCGSAMYWGRAVISENLQQDTRWRDFLDRPWISGLQSCWSMPIFDRQQRVIGTFGLYRTEPGSPDPSEWDMIRTCAELAAPAIELHRLTQELRQRERLYRLLADNTSDMVVVRGLDGRVKYASPSLLRQAGYSEAEYSAMPLTELVHPDDFSAVLRAWEGAIRGATGTVQWRRRHPQRDYVWQETHFRPMHDHEGKVEAILTQAREIDAERRVQLRLQSMQHQQQLLLESISAVPWTCELTAPNFSYVGKQAEDLLGYSVKEWLTPGFWASRLHPEDKEFAIGFCRRETEAGRDHQFEYRMIHRDGSVIWVLELVSLLLDGSDVVGICGFLINITQQKQLEHERQALQQRLETSQRLESLGLLAGGVAHDFNNLLTPILGFAGLAKQDATPGSSQAEFLAKIELAAHRAAGLCSQLLTHAGRGTGLRERFPLNAMVQEVITLVERSSPTSTWLVQRLSAQPITIEGNASQIHQVVMNLLLNALEAATGTDATVTITTQLVDAPMDSAGLSVQYGRFPASGRAALLEVVDTGPGMSSEVLQRILEPFFTTKDNGRGLGLSTVRGVVQGHAGLVTVESRVHEGTTIRVYLPCSEPEPASPPQRPQSSGVRPVRRILVVDDEMVVRDLIQTIAQSRGIDVTVAADLYTLAAIPNVGPGRWDLALVDLRLTGASGLEVARWLRQRDRHLPLIIMTGLADELTLTSDLQELGAKFMPKPFSAEKISHLLDTVAAPSMPNA